MVDPCPECEGTEFHHIGFEGGRYGEYQGDVVLRTDYWFEKGGLYTECENCHETLFKHPAYDVLDAWEEYLEPGGE